MWALPFLKNTNKQWAVMHTEITPAGERRADWQAELDSYVRANEHVPFDWQSQNCMTFAATWAQIANGRQASLPAAKTAREALRVVKGLGGLYADACENLGLPLPGAFARCGDVVLLKVPRSRGRVSLAFGVCLGAVCAAPSATGLMMLPITEAEAAWRV